MNEITYEQTGQSQFTLTCHYPSNGTHVYIYKYSDIEPAVTTPTQYILDTLNKKVVVDLEDGVYILKIYNLDFTPATQYIPLYVFASIQTCLNAFNEQLLCSDANDDCQECDETEEVEIRRCQHEFNKLTLLFWMIMGYVNWEKITYLDYWGWNEDRGKFVNKVGLMMDKMIEIAGNCQCCK